MENKEIMRRALLAFASLLVLSPTISAQSAGSGLPPAELKQKVEGFVRKLFAMGPTYRVTVGEPKEAKLPGFYEVLVEVAVQDSTDQAVMYVSKDGKVVVRGEVYQTDGDLFASTKAQMRLGDQASKGPADAKVVFVEYADFQCHSCRQLYDVLKQLVPLYPQVKFVFKDFPLEQIHPWARNAAAAGRCAYKQNPAAFWKLHDLLFENQATITAANHWQTLQDYAGQVGLDTTAFRTCLTAPETKAYVDESIQEAIRLRIANTPTVFINGRRVVGGNREQIEQILQFELASASGTAPARPR
jgi:protein-disulfide isomerase